ncbi:MAG: hypothetical protein QGI32_01185 [Candidatus Latescibacteria bacterium]|jgi:hypothetical protein|nr:hypothetical protein [Candidatus Latescibacterota bacterium]
MKTRWDKIRSAELDAPAREEIARLIREEKASEPALERQGSVVEFRRGGQLLCGYLAGTPQGRLRYRVIGVDGRPCRLRRDKIVDVSREQVSTWPPENRLRSLRVVDENRDRARRDVDLATLWQVVIEADADRVLASGRTVGTAPRDTCRRHTTGRAAAGAVAG